MMKRASLALFLWAAGSLAISARPSEEVVTVKVIPPVESFKPGGTYILTLEISVSSPYHINAEQPSEDYLIGTTVNFKRVPGIIFGKVVFPSPETIRLSFSENPLAVYTGLVKVSAGVTLAKEFKGNAVVIEGAVGYQACNDQSCLPPTEVPFSKSIPLAAVTSRGEAASGPQPESQTPPEAAPVRQPTDKAEASGQKEPAPSLKEKATTESGLPEQASGNSQIANKATSPFEGKGLFLTFILVFMGGLGLNLTPCVYPLIPITISYFGGQAAGKKGRVVLHAILYVMGMAVTYSVLGVIAAFTGSLLGAALQYPLVLVFIALVMILLALSMFDVYELRLPGFLNKLAGGSPKGYLGTLSMGLTVGIVAAPCIGPFVLGLLTYVGNRGSILLGFSLFFVLALGLGVPFVFLGIFSGSLNNLPRSGVWMVWVRKIFGFVLIAMALYFLKSLFPNGLFYSLSLALTMLIAGLYLAWLEPSQTPGKAFRYVRTAAGLIFFGAALFVSSSGIKDYLNDAVAQRIRSLAGPGTTAASASIFWQPYSEERIAEAARLGRPVFIDSYADWCIPCKELDKKTFNQSEVIAAARDFVMLKADLTHKDDAAQAFYSKYRVKGVPTLIFLKRDGTEIEELRGTGFETKDVFLHKMKRAVELSAGK